MKAGMEDDKRCLALALSDDRLHVMRTLFIIKVFSYLIDKKAFPVSRKVS